MTAESLDDFLLRCLHDDFEEIEYIRRYAQDYLDHFPDRKFDQEWKWVHLTKPADRKHGWSSRHFETDFDPEWVARELQFRERLVQMYQALTQRREWAEAEMSAMWAVLLVMAKEYADRPGYRPEWRTT